ncbi:uncharacterized protein F4807DRAFT_471073 [Annulohypoxylon truncatum]|uniref:uncharacterized protein n=1 Tax=Annulohypoxylon truncatum TaxID=327061 RepID=UPI0020075C4B|nr:uncharacterized protein F4807DRAFT_471073 [Annulohypoxylon truncatum]KAI1205394.1 hypothetical protein F4807DRAFT_471073 [Annulohypoxylon truncatum]
MASQNIDTVDTSNFIEVLRYFDEDGNIANPNTRFDIQCGICREKNLALLNPAFDKRSRETHETYAVLPNCGHAFGYVCLSSWIFSNSVPTCPTCRKRIFNRDQPRVLSMFGDSGIEEQHLEVLDIKGILHTANSSEAEVSFRLPRADDPVVRGAFPDGSVNGFLNAVVELPDFPWILRPWREILEEELDLITQELNDITEQEDELEERLRYIGRLLEIAPDT